MKKYRFHSFGLRLFCALCVVGYAFFVLTMLSLAWGNVVKHQGLIVLSFSQSLAQVDTAIDAAQQALKAGQISQSEYASIARTLCEGLQAMQMSAQGDEVLIYSHRCVLSQQLFLRLRGLREKNSR